MGFLCFFVLTTIEKMGTNGEESMKSQRVYSIYHAMYAKIVG